MRSSCTNRETNTIITHVSSSWQSAYYGCSFYKTFNLAQIHSDEANSEGLKPQDMTGPVHGTCTSESQPQAQAI